MPNFAALFDPDLSNEALADTIKRWQEAYLSRSAQTRIRLARHSSAGSEVKILIGLPKGETRMVEMTDAGGFMRNQVTFVTA